jgi:hypothetical protein
MGDLRAENLPDFLHVADHRKPMSLFGMDCWQTVLVQDTIFLPECIICWASAGGAKFWLSIWRAAASNSLSFCSSI